jgi:hypothetical protein
MNDLVGKRFCRLMVLDRTRNRGSYPRWKCLCECGKSKIVLGTYLQQGFTKSCGCLSSETHRIGRNFKDGRSRTREYRAFYAARARCKDLQNKKYGGRGIRFRFKSFEQFRSEIGRRPSAKHSLDRINTNGHYESGNVRWATRHQQRMNQRQSS